MKERVMKIEKQKIYIPHAEIPVVEQCNLNCSLCNSHAYLIDNSEYPLEQFKKDVDILSEYIHFGFLTFMGGEPLLCENLYEYINYAKEKQLGEVCRVLTNGFLVRKMSPELMEAMDVLEISHYPQMKATVSELNDYLEPLSKKYGFTYYIKKIKYFNCIDTVALSEEAAQQGYEKCSRITDGCSIFNGYYYKCMRPKTTNLYLEKEYGIISDVNMREADGLKISEENFVERFIAYRNRKERLEACKYCLMGLESECSAIEGLKHWAYGYPWVIKTFYKSRFLYHGFKMFKKIFQYDEGAHYTSDEYIRTECHKVRDKSKRHPVL
ncbi:4Fe-4S single cluster domain-containing protein [Pseudobutyrivibrio sp. 49]|uniref:radical SAM protein n=1 Tax=Pseudobutyrivibrio sp. 49 TaxID=1855344 RepID=UPI00088FC9FD|nr:radical SAM protein [Pseudobutyrivibrio sp. 49]SDI72023.1 4Fe-4S single cluster domain-containing protein [Pseudobutyrivibrio sp. 49]